MTTVKGPSAVCDIHGHPDLDFGRRFGIIAIFRVPIGRFNYLPRSPLEPSWNHPSRELYPVHSGTAPRNHRESF